MARPVRGKPTKKYTWKSGPVLPDLVQSHIHLACIRRCSFEVAPVVELPRHKVLSSSSGRAVTVGPKPKMTT